MKRIDIIKKEPPYKKKRDLDPVFVHKAFFSTNYNRTLEQASEHFYELKEYRSFFNRRFNNFYDSLSLANHLNIKYGSIWDILSDVEPIFYSIDKNFPSHSDSLHQRIHEIELSLGEGKITQHQFLLKIRMIIIQLKNEFISQINNRLSTIKKEIKKLRKKILTLQINIRAIIHSKIPIIYDKSEDN